MRPIRSLTDLFPATLPKVAVTDAPPKVNLAAIRYVCWSIEIKVRECYGSRINGRKNAMSKYRNQREAISSPFIGRLSGLITTMSLVNERLYNQKTSSLSVLRKETHRFLGTAVSRCFAVLHFSSCFYSQT